MQQYKYYPVTFNCVTHIYEVFSTVQSRLHKESAMSLEQQAREEEAEEEEGAADYHPLTANDGNTKIQQTCSSDHEGWVYMYACVGAMCVM